MYQVDKERFLEEEQEHVLRLSGKILSRPITKSDDEFVIALSALSQAVDSYEEEKGDFWKYANVVIRNKLYDYVRSENRFRSEVNTKPEIMEGNSQEDEDLALQNKIAKQTATPEESDLKYEIMEITEMLSEYGISFFDLAKCSPKALKTRRKVAEVIRAIFLPPPLVKEIRKLKRIPASEIRNRCEVTTKILDNYRKYIISSALILDGDFPGIQEYLKYVWEEDAGR